MNIYTPLLLLQHLYLADFVRKGVLLLTFETFSKDFAHFALSETRLTPFKCNNALEKR